MEDKSYEISNQPAGRHGLGNDHIILCDYSLQTSDGSTNTLRVMPSNSEQEQLLSGTGMVSRARGGMVLGQGDALKLITNADNATISTITLASGATSSYKTTTGNKILKYDFDFVPKSGIFAWEVGNKVYELKDHLGNVRSLIADYRAADGSGNPIATLQHYAHYYPGGSPQPGRQFNSGSYRYGHNTQESDPEISGSWGSHYTAQFWMYDSRIIRRWNLDPKPNPSISQYNCFAGNPIWYSDVLGDTLKVKGGLGFKLRVHTTLAVASVFSKDAREKINDLKESTNVHTIEKKTSGGNYSQSDSYGVDDSPLGLVTTYVDRRGRTHTFTGTGKGTGSTIGWDINSAHGGKDVTGSTKRPKKIGLLHEIFHSWQMDKGAINRTVVNGVKQSERDATHFENQMRSQLSIVKAIQLRQYYGSNDILRRDFDYSKNEPIPPASQLPQFPKLPLILGSEER